MSWNKNRVKLVGHNLLRFTAGYGERPLRTVLWAGSVVLLFAVLSMLFGDLKCEQRNCTVLDSLYFSTISFSAVGYGSWAPAPNQVGQFLGVFESFLGVFTMALFVTLFVRKMSR